MRLLLLFCCFSLVHSLKAQELFVYTEPASNMAAKSIGVRLDNYLGKEKISGNTNYTLQTELMWAISRKFMVHGSLYFSNNAGAFGYNALSFYGKYRFYSQDEVHSHFRMAAFFRLTNTSTFIPQEAIDLNGMRSGEEGGLVATKLINKVALSATTSFVHSNAVAADKYFPGVDRNAMSYSFSAGKLLLPKQYINYNQPNLNGMLEVLGQTDLRTGRSYLDLAPSLQLILMSKMRLDFGYRIAVVNDLSRLLGNTMLVRLEYNFFNVYK